MHYGSKRIAGCHVNIGSLAYVLDDLAEVDQVGWIQNIADNWCHTAAWSNGRTRDGNVRVIGRKNTIIPRSAHEPSVVLCEPIDTEFLIIAQSQLPNHRTQ